MRAIQPTKNVWPAPSASDFCGLIHNQQTIRGRSGSLDGFPNRTVETSPMRYEQSGTAVRSCME